MSRHHNPVDYDKLAATYDRRFAYEAGARKGVAATLLALADEVRARRVLEVGCGTGRWLEILTSSDRWVCGLDPSVGMLEVARASR
jgi:ubiquinone/menaquinone biosynthesis C-methylase UbiE